jgi:molecular chaperone GrpE
MMNETRRPDAAATPAETEATTTSPETGGPDPLVAAVQEAASFKDKLLRALADMENLRRRTEREVADARTYGIASFARDIVGVADNFRRALDAVGPELRTAADAEVKALIEGVELTERELLKSLEKNGIKKIEPQGEKFDPNLHQAMYEVPDASVPAGSVAQVVQPGYVIGDRVLRPALVGVSKGGPKTAPGQNAGANASPRSPGES